MADDKKSRIQLAGGSQADEYLGTHRIENSGALTLTRADGSTVTYGPGQWVSVEGDQTGSGGASSTPEATSGSLAGADSGASSTGSGSTTAKK